MVIWDDVCLSKEKGGLGIRRLATLNKALLGKWAWRFAVEDNPMWKKVITLKYHIEEGGLVHKRANGQFRSGHLEGYRKCSQKIETGLLFCFWGW